MDGKGTALGLVENQHKNHILDLSIFPARVSDSVQKQAVSMASTLAERLDYVGLFGLEFFLVQDQLVCNEFAPRPHNSGHLSQDSGGFSQFDLHLRAVLGYPCPEPQELQHTVMKNLIGEDTPILAELARSKSNDSRYQLHDYGKTELRSGRKMGHLNFRGRLEEIDPRFL